MDLRLRQSARPNTVAFCAQEIDRDQVLLTLGNEGIGPSARFDRQRPTGAAGKSRRHILGLTFGQGAYPATPGAATPALNPDSYRQVAVWPAVLLEQPVVGRGHW